MKKPLEEAKILVLGDLMLDRYVRGDVNRISPEAPVPVVRVTRERNLLGGAANVAANLVAIGVQTSMMAVCGTDLGGTHLLELLDRSQIDTDLILTSNERMTTIKTRIVAGQQQIVRVDREELLSISEDECTKLLNQLEEHWDSFDAIIISDYKKGLLSDHLLDGIRNLSIDRPKIITADPKERKFGKYCGFTLCTPNRLEFETASGVDCDDKNALKAAGKTMRSELELDALLVTLGKDGMALFNQEDSIFIETEAREVFDVTGAGDTVISVLTACLCLGLDFEQAARAANLAAGRVVARMGVATLSEREMEKILKRFE
tara:strand:- start:1643 stop:2599 length:957 start_codon:yes stop_codon:yes gene_type:complete